MKLNFAGERILAVAAHPDDVEILCAGTLARAREEGAVVGICIICQGEKGQPDPPVIDLAQQRAQEMRQAADLLGAELSTGWVADSELYDGDAHRAVLVDRLRAFRPTLVLSHSPDDYHADHRAAAQLTDVCSWLATSRGFLSPVAPLAEAPEVWSMDTVGMHQFEPGFYIDVTRFMNLKEQMLRCHRSQLQRSADSTFAPLLEVMRLQASTRGLQARCGAAEAYRVLDRFKRCRGW